MSDFKKQFEAEKVFEVGKKLGINNPAAVPRLVKIAINTSGKEYVQDKKNLEKAREELTLLSGQVPKTARARLSIAAFKLREGDQIGLSVTLRGKRMYDFFEKLVTIVLPRVKDFNGVDDRAFDKRGNLTIGFAEHTVFPEIEPGKVDKMRGFQLTIVTNAGNAEAGRVLLEKMGMSFKKK